MDFADIADMRLGEDIKTAMTFDLTLDGDHDYDGLMDDPIVAATQIKGLTSIPHNIRGPNSEYPWNGNTG